MKTSRKSQVKLDVQSRKELEKADQWKDKQGRFSENQLVVYWILNATHSRSEEKIEFLKKLDASATWNLTKTTPRDQNVRGMPLLRKVGKV